MNKFLLATLLGVASTAASAAPALIVTPSQTKGATVTYTVEFVADKRAPVSALIYEFKTSDAMSKKGVTVGTNPQVKLAGCTSGLRSPFSGVCNPATADGSVRVVVYSAQPGAVLPSGTIGEIVVPRSLAKAAGNGAPELGFVEFTSPEGTVIQGETLVDSFASTK